MNFLAKLLQGISLAPSVINGVEGLLEPRPEPKRRALL